MSAFIGDVMDQSIPVLERMAVTMQKLKDVGDARRDQVLKSLEKAQDDLEPVMQQAIGQFDLFLKGTEEAVLGVLPAPARAAAEVGKANKTARAAPVTNRGATTLPPKPLKANGDGGFKAVSKRKVFSKTTV